jgi:hypothetical protein
MMATRPIEPGLRRNAPPMTSARPSPEGKSRSPSPASPSSRPATAACPRALRIPTAPMGQPASSTMMEINTAFASVPRRRNAIDTVRWMPKPTARQTLTSSTPRAPKKPAFRPHPAIEAAAVLRAGQTTIGGSPLALAPFGRRRSDRSASSLSAGAAGHFNGGQVGRDGSALGTCSEPALAARSARRFAEHDLARRAASRRPCRLAHVAPACSVRAIRGRAGDSIT